MGTLDIPCYAFSARAASRRLSQFYEHKIVGSGIHAQQFTILAIVKHKGPLSVLDLADELGMDRTTLARSLKPLARDELISIAPTPQDKRIKMISITPLGSRTHTSARKKWLAAQTEFEKKFGAERAANLRAELKAAAQIVSM